MSGTRIILGGLLVLALLAFYSQPKFGGDVIVDAPIDAPVTLPVLPNDTASLRTALIGKDAKQSANIKADLVVRDTTTGEYTDSKYGYRIEITQSAQKIDGGVELYARAWKGNEPVGFIDGTVEIEHFIFYNPPVFVPDALGDYERKITDSAGITTGKFRYDPFAAIKETLAHTISVSGKDGSKVIVGKIGHTTTTVFPDPNPETTTTDGFVTRGGVNETFGTIRAGAGTSFNDSSDGYVDLLASATTNQYQSHSKSIALFDTSSIPDTDVVSSATISIASRGAPSKIDQLGSNGQIGITAATTASNTGLSNSDYENSLSTTRLANTDIDVGSWAADSTYNNWTLNASGISNISLTGVSKFAYRLGFDIDNTTTGITWASGQEILARVYYADKAGTSADPKLVVVHAAAVAATGEEYTIIYD